MVIGKIKVTGTRAYTTEAMDIPQGIIGAEVSFDFSADWAGLVKNVVFVGAKDVEILNIQDRVYLPPEVVSATNINVRVGVVGLDANKKLVIPTLWADLGTVKPAAPVDMGYDPTLPIWAQLLGMIGDLRNLSTVDKSSLVAAVNEAMRNGGGGAGGYYTPIVTQPTDNTLTISFVPSVATMPAVEPVTINLSGSNSGQSVELDTTLTVAGKAADAKAVGDKIAEITGVSLVEPAEDDIPKIFFGGALQQTKTEAVVPFRYISKTEDFSGYAEIKAQGNSSMSYPKKNQTVKMFADEACETKMKKDFKGWGKQNKHVYKANWIDLSHARNVVSARLWADVVKSRANYATLPELLRTAPNQGAVDGFPVKVYAAGVYQGRYTLNIPKDAWTFNMDDELDNHCVLCGEGYVSGCFREASVSQWTDEIHDAMPAAIKNRWLEVINFVMNSTDAEFRANLSQYFYVDSLIDYYLFGLVSCGLDAFGKNQIYATYDSQWWIASMYDMDSTWGLYWNGGSIVATDYSRSEFQDFKDGQGNLLYIRLENLFVPEIQARWAELENGALSIENIINRFERFTDIAPAELVKEDYATTTGGGKFTGIPSKDTNNIQQIRSFALARQAWTDGYIAGLTPSVPVPCTGISLNNNTMTFTGEGTQTLTATVTPEGCTDPVFWESNNASVAIVEHGVVTAIANGVAAITVRCGGYSATCSVSVSGIVEPVPCTGITIDKSALTFTEEGSQTIVATVTPDNTTDPIVWSSDDESVATVENGVVTTVWNGTANIKATCGEHSATCSVSVSGITLDVTKLAVGVTYELPVTAGGYYNHNNGNKAGSSADSYSDEYITIPEGADYIKINTIKNVSVCFFNESKEFVSGKLNSMTGVAITHIPDNVRYMRFSIGTVEKTAVSFRFDSYGWAEWKAEPKYAYDNKTGAEKSGTNYITVDPNIPVPNGATVIRIGKVAGTTYGYIGFAVFDASGKFLKYDEMSGYVDLTSLDNPDHFGLTAFPNNSETNNDPANQVFWYHNGIA